MRFAEMTIKDFLQELAEGSPTPGGGSVAALSGALSAALSSMVAGLTVGRSRYQEVWPEMEEVREQAEEQILELQELIDRDAGAYNRVMAAMKMSRDDQVQKEQRRQAIQEATLEAARVPLQTLRAAASVADLLQTAADRGNPNGITDAGVGGQLMLAAARGAALNVRVNLSGLQDEGLVQELKDEVQDLLQQVEAAAGDLERKVEDALG
jgi:formiminotetrahydrofolate cyclodeaminase